MSEPTKSESGKSIFLLALDQAEATSLGEWLRATNVELEGILQRIKASREESERLAAQTEEVMSKLRLEWLC
jgi:hypothetical protein